METIDHVLKKLMNEIDIKSELGVDINRKSVVKQYTEDPIEKKVYDGFMIKYAKLKSAYLKEKNSLTNLKKLEIDYKKVGTNAFWGSVVAYDTISNMTTILLGAMIGGGITYYDQKKDANMDLSKLFWWSIIGRGIGGYLDPKNSNFYSTLGTAFGCGIAALKELKKVGPSLTPEEKRMKLQPLELTIYQDMQLLIHNTRIEYFNKMSPSF